MPFIKYADSDHRCTPPNKRDNNTPLQTGDEWRCHHAFSRQPGQVIPPRCNKVWRWAASTDQREPGNYWKAI
jgi:hypothetical protein